MVCPLAVEASGGGIPVTGECPVRTEADQASGGGTIEMTQRLLQPMAAKGSDGIVAPPKESYQWINQ